MIYVCIIMLLIAFQGCALPLIVAHRGASHDAPENTLPAFELAWRQGADAVEGDFRLTRDGQIICIHDDNTKRTADQDLRVSRAALAELKTLDVGAWKAEQWKGARIPTLAEVIATVPEDKRIYIEIKCGPEIAGPLFETTGRSTLTNDQIVIISFKEEVIREIKARMPEWKALWLAGFERDDHSVLTAREALGTLRAINADGISTSASDKVDAAFVNAIMEAGFEYHAWTIDDPALADRFIALGARSITTNAPGRLIEDLRR